MSTKVPYQKPTLTRRGPLAPITADQVPVSGVTDGGPSDIRLKEDIQRVGTTVHGLALYQFRYRGRTELYEGVMAQDVLKVMPDAVVGGTDGYLRVNYALLGAPFRQVS